MSKGPTPRHSKPPKPVTIDLDATDVTPAQPGDDASGKSKDTAKTGAGKASAGASATGKEKPAADQAAAKAVESGSGGMAAKNPTSVPGAGSRKTGDAAVGSSSAAATSAETKKDEPKAGKDGSAASSASEKTGGANKDRGKDPGKSPDKGTDTDTASSRPAAAAKDTMPKGGATPSSGSKGGGLGMVASGVIGAIIALGGGYALQTAGMLPAPVGQSASQGQVDVQALASRVDGLSGTVDDLSTQVSGLSTASADGGAGQGEASAEMMARLERLESAIAVGETGSPEAAAGLAGLTERLDELESRVNTLASSAGDGSGNTELSSAITDLRASQSGVSDAVTELQSRTQELSETVSGLQQDQTEMQTGLEQRITSIEERLDEPSRQVDLARAIAGAGLRTAIDRGGPFMSELEAFASVAPEDPAVPELRDLAARGVPSRSELIEAFPEAASQAIAAANPADPDAGLVDRLMSSALSVVKVRPVGDVEGDTADAIVARTETRLMDGNFDAALNEWRNLPEASQQAASGFGDGLAARVQAEKLISSSLSPAAAPSEAPAN
ncbi:MAG: mitofilin family membrane protein [Hoeflea sp.]|uniref:COG4223 family protein n=1 Tax=Hoeflea sp. TaxID=1940281 RepID=UPI0032EF1F5E